MLFRTACKKDLEAIYQLTSQAGVGMTTLPNDKEYLRNRLKWSIESLEKQVETPGNEYYLFVLEDPKTHTVIGTSGIKAALGCDTPFYSYKVSKHTNICHSLNIRNDHETLHLVNDNHGHSEVCTLFLDAAHRCNGNGLLLSRARFLFIKQQPKRFAPIIIAEMRGVSDDEGYAPFWDHLGRYFFHIPFTEADHLTTSTDKQFIADLMPKYPISVSLLHPEAQAVIGKPHESTAPAMHILLREGFYYNHYIDIFDGGPTIEAQRDSIRTIRNSRIVTVQDTLDEISSKRYIIATNQLHMRATIDHIALNASQDSCSIRRETAELLQVNIGDSLHIALLS